MIGRSTGSRLYVWGCGVRHGLAAASWGRAVDFHSEGQEVLPSIEQASILVILLSMCDEAQEDELAGDPDY